MLRTDGHPDHREENAEERFDKLSPSLGFERRLNALHGGNLLEVDADAHARGRQRDVRAHNNFCRCKEPIRDRVKHKQLCTH